MAEDNGVGKPIPKGVVDVEHDFVGVPDNDPNYQKQVAKLKKQVATMRRQIEGDAPARSQGAVSRSFVAFAATLGLAAVAAFLLPQKTAAAPMEAQLAQYRRRIKDLRRYL
jgi:hypothetical protein